MRLLLILSFLLFTSHVWANLNVLSYNVFAKPDPGQAQATKERMEKICNQLKKSDYDVVLLQEVWMKRYRKQFKNCGYPYVMDQKNYRGSKNELSLGSGLLILSRYPITESYRYKLPIPRGARAFFLHGENLARKSLYLAKVSIGSKEVWIGNTHLIANYCDNEEWYRCADYEWMRRIQIDFIADIFDRKVNGAPAVFGGDLNMGPKKIARDEVWDEMDYLFPGFSQGDYDDSVTTFSSENIFNRGQHDPGKIDHLFFSEQFSVLSNGVSMKDTFVSSKGKVFALSDHYGWEATVNLK